MRFASVAVCLLACIGRAETIEFEVLKEGELEQMLRLAHPKVSERYLRLRRFFEESGCSNLREQKVRGAKEPNLICPVGGGSSRRIVVGAHFDSAGGDGVIDNWTGAILIPSLARFARAKPRRHSFEFVGFAAEEKGLLGSKAYLNALKPEERDQIAAVITIDSLGLTPIKFWPNSSTKELVNLAAVIAHSMGLRLVGINMDRVGSTDSATFYRASIPVLSLHSVTQETWQIINSKKDVWQSLSWKDYYDSHKFLSALLTYLDQKLP
jgi:hypothetical protein